MRHDGQVISLCFRQFTLQRCIIPSSNSKISRTSTNMHYSTAILFPLLPLALAAVDGPCAIDGTPGVCVTTSNCAAADGSFRSGFCPNDPDNVRCCIKPECGSGGNCRSTSSCDGTPKAGLCPGPSTFQCCQPGSGGGGGAPGGGGSTGDLSLSANGVDFIAGFEGFEPNFYNDAAVSVNYPGSAFSLKPAHLLIRA